VYAGDTEIRSEEENLNTRIQIVKQIVLKTGLKAILGQLASLA